MLFLFKPLENKGFINKKGVSDLTLPFYEMKKKLWDFDGTVIIYAEWDNQVCTIQSKKQIVCLK